jgi:acetylornithine deacetylase
MQDDFMLATAILRKLVAFDTTSRNSNMALINYVAEFLASHGVQADLVWNAEGTKANLIARIGPDAPGGILLSGHTDVVPVDGQTWTKTKDPWTLHEENGRYYGRGVADMKGFDACALSKVPEWAKANLQRPIYIVLSYDEEVGCKGIGSALQVLNERGIQPELCIVGEPTLMEVVYAHKARADILVEALASGGHASKYADPDITSAFALASHLQALFDKKAKKIGKKLGDRTTGKASLAVTANKMENTHNVIPSACHLHFDFRGGAGMTQERILDVLNPLARKVLKRYRKQGRTGAADFRLTATVGNGGFCCVDDRAIALGQKLADTHRMGVAPYVCEAARYDEAGFGQTIICGPGSISQAHQPDEWVDIQELVACRNMMDRITAHVMQPGGVA